MESDPGIRWSGVLDGAALLKRKKEMKRGRQSRASQNVSLFARRSVSSTQALDLTFSPASSRPLLNDDLLHIVFLDVLDLLSESTRNSGRGAAMLPFTLVCQA